MRKIEFASLSDCEFLVQSQLNMAIETEDLKLDHETVTKGVKAVFANPQLGRYLICRVDGVPSACLLILNEWSDWRNGNVMWIHSVFVVKEHRRKGIYQEMYEHLKKLVMSGEYRGIRLYVDKRNTTAQNTYKSLGMDANHYDLYEWLP
ncbi:MAG: GNAT family N-acetyltransferase [Bdellovibrionales bacterium]|nr:GNAT family N-acetyltransferase [Bdellovibrionales bacterium]